MPQAQHSPQPFGLGSSPSMLVGKYGPETDAALEKLALAGINIGIPAGLSLLGGPAGFSVGETLMSVLMGCVAAATPPRHDDLMMGVVPFGPGGSRLQRMQAGEAIGDAEMRLLFNQTPESLVRIGRKGGLASGAARRAKAAAGELADEGRYTGPEIGHETTHEASMALDAEFAHLKDAFKQTDADKVGKAYSAMGGRAGGGANRSAAVRAARDVAEMRIKLAADPVTHRFKWALHPETEQMLLSKRYASSRLGAGLSHAEWFENIGLPASGKAFDQTIRGDVFVTKGGQIVTESQWMGPNEWSAQTGYDTDAVLNVLRGSALAGVTPIRRPVLRGARR